MSQIIITTEDRDFVVFDTSLNQIIHYQDKTKQLDSPKLKNQGRNTFRPFGIAIDESSIYIASNDKLGKFNKASYEFEELVKVPLFINTHQILKSGDTFYTCNTAVDCIGISDLVSGKTTQFNVNYLKTVKLINYPKNAGQLDSRHVNTIYEYDDKVFFCRHNKDFVNSDIGYFEKNTGKAKMIISAGRCCHGIVIRNNYLYTLSTKTGELIEVNLDTFKLVSMQLVNPKDSFLRGLDLIGDELIIGSSVNIKNTEAIQECFLLFFNFSSSKTYKYVLEGVEIINDLKGFKNGL